MLQGKRNREIAALQRRIDEVPTRAELSQYQCRFIELYNQGNDTLTGPTSAQGRKAGFGFYLRHFDLLSPGQSFGKCWLCHLTSWTFLGSNLI